MIDICLFGREISDLVRVFGTSLRFILLSSVARGLFVRPVVVVIEGDARGGLRRDDYVARCVAVQKIPFAPLVLRRSSGCSVRPTRRTRRSGLVEGPRRGSIRPDVRVGQIFL